VQEVSWLALTPTCARGDWVKGPPLHSSQACRLAPLMPRSESAFKFQKSGRCASIVRNRRVVSSWCARRIAYPLGRLRPRPVSLSDEALPKR
jgi:hypothetical protein